MASRMRHRVAGHAGVFFVEVPRVTGSGMEKVYYIRYRRSGKLIEEKVGGQYRDNMTPVKAAVVRGLRIEGRELSNAERRKAVLEEKTEQENRYTLNKVWTLFEADKRGNRSIGDDRTRFGLHIAPLLGNKELGDIVIADVDALRSRLERSGKAPQTVKHVLMLLKRLLRFAVRRGYLEALPGTLHIAMPLVDNRVTENLTAEQVHTLLRVLDEESDQRIAALMKLALFTGMRRKALLHLQWSDLDFERGFITLRGEAAKKGKTETIPMNEQARAILRDVPRTASPYVFPGRTANSPRANISSLLKRVREKAGLPPSFRPLHGLRHSFASWLASSGQVSMYELQKLLTHNTPQMTQRYAHLHDDALRRASGVAATLFGNLCGESPFQDSGEGAFHNSFEAQRGLEPVNRDMPGGE